MGNRSYPVIARPQGRCNPEQKTGSPRMLRVLATTLLLFCASLPAAAQVPGDACATAQQYIVNGGPETSGVVHLMVCEGGTWKSILSANALAEVTKIGNQICANGDYFKYDGTKFICTTGSGGSGAIDDLTDAFTDYVTNHNLTMGRAGAGALFAGAQYNTFVGEQAGPVAGTSASMNNNTALGYQALTNLTSGESNTALGYWAMKDNQGGWENVAIGNYSLYQNITGNNNVAVGYGSLSANTTGYLNVAIGQGSLATNVANVGSTAIGYAAMLYANDTATGIETYNTAVGAYALQGSGTAANNTGVSNTAVGHSALLGITSGTNNTAVGVNALTTTSSGVENTAIGSGAMSSAAGAGSVRNTAVGYQALTGVTGGSGNTAIGHQALASAGDGNANVAIGEDALEISSGTEGNVAIGHEAGDSNTDGDNNILIGWGADTPAATTSNHLNIGGTIFGDVSTDNVRIGGSGTVGAGPLIANPPTSEVIAAAAVITANACGTVKQINATANRTTNTTDTFTAPTASYAGCCMDVVNVDTVDTITLDQNAKFFTGSGADVALAPGKGVRVCSDGTSWYQAGGVSSASGGGGGAISALTAASGSNSINNGDNAQTWNWQLTTTNKDAFTFTENTASTATGHSSILKAATLATSTATPLMVTNLGTANSFIVNDETGDNDTSPFVIQNDGDVGIGTANPGTRLHVYESGNIPGRLQIEGPTTDQQSSELLLVTSGDSSTVLGGGGAMRGWSLEGVGQSNATTAHRNDFNIAYYDGSVWNHHFWIDNAGSVGIGTTTPQDKLDIYGGNLRISGSSGSVAISRYNPSGANQDMAFDTSYGEVMRLTSGGGVGIGTISPNDGAKPHKFAIEDDVTVGSYHDDVGQLQIRGTAGSSNSPKQLTLGVNTDAVTSYGWIQSSQNGTASRALSLNPDGGFVGIGTATPQSKLHVPDGNYAQFEDNNAGAPPGADCDADTERGRMSIDTTNNRLYICNGATRGWDYVALTN